MSKTATKAGENVFYCARIEAAKCNERLSSREGAAEELGIDRTRIARIELGSLTPYPEEVLLMSDAYKAPQLVNYYCSRLCPLGQKTVPSVEIPSLDRLTVKVIAALEDAEFVHREMIQLGKDGKITEDEWPKIKEVSEALKQIEKTSMEMRLWIDKNIGSEGH